MPRLRILHPASLAIFAILVTIPFAIAQDVATVPSMVKVSGTVREAKSRILGVTFALYKDEQVGSPLWMETQSVSLDSAGHYNVQLGATLPAGLPKELFASGEARWLGVQPEGQVEQPRVLLLSVPYALKAADAETVGGLPPSAFVLASKATAETASVKPKASVTHPNGPSPNVMVNVTTNGGTANTLPVFSTSTDIENSIVTQSAGSIGIGIAVPAATLDVNGTANVRGNLTSTAYVNATSGYELGGRLFGFTTGGNLNPYFGFAGNVADTGVENAGMGNGALTSNTSGIQNTALGWATLKLNTTGSANTALGLSALYSNVSGSNNTAVGGLALSGNTADNNSALGYEALLNNTSGSGNTASGVSALGMNTTGGDNTAIGIDSLFYNTTGSFNTALGYFAATDPNISSLTNATSIGAFSDVTASNSLILGATSGVNGAPFDTNVGIGLTAPVAKLHIGSPSGGAATTSLRIEGPSRSGTGGFAASLGGFGDFNIDAVGIVGGRFTVKENGRVGIGTASPVNPLTVNGTANFGRVSIATSSPVNMLTVNGTADFGRVGIGTTSPDAALTVNGSADKPGGGAWAVFSDRRLKDLHGTFNSGLSQVLKINPIRYRYKDQNGMDIHDSDEHIGLVAQEVQKVIPEAVSKNEKGYLLVNNDPIIWTMLNAIKEQQQQIRSQRARTRAQDAAIRTLQSQLKETRETLRKVTTQLETSHAPLLASK